MKEKPKKKRILISVTDKTGIGKFGVLLGYGYEIISTGGTAKTLTEAGIPCTLIEDVTGFPEMMDGRLKTLHPKIFGGILADRYKLKHLASMVEHGIVSIDIVVVNLYAFDKNPCIENIDIGGPSLLRAGAKNGNSVVPIVDPADYDEVIQNIIDHGEVCEVLVEDLAMKVFDYTANYDRLIHDWMKKERKARRCIFFGAPSSH